MMKHLLSLLFCLGLLSSCLNVFDPFDSPTNDAQILSAARACFDKQDYTCAREQYQKLSSNESAIAEQAFMILDQNDAGIVAIARALSNNTSDGDIISKLVESVAPNAGQTKRADLLSAYKTISNIQNQQLRGFVKFITGMVLASEILAEIPGVQADSIFQKTDIANTPSACQTANVTNVCTGVDTTSCASPVGGGLSGSVAIPALSSNPNVAGMTGTANFGMYQAALLAAADGLALMSVNSGNSSAIITALNNSNTTTGTPPDDCFNYYLIQTGIGR
jgi:hypothetical protein